MRQSSLRPYLWMLLGSLAFSLMSTLTHKVGEHAGWQFIALVRSILPTALMAALCLGAGVRLVVFRPGALWWRSLAGSASMVFTFYALTHMPVPDALTLTNTFPLWIALLSGPLAGERAPLKVWLALLVAVAGVGVILQPHFASGEWAALAALTAAFLTALAMLGLHRLRGVDARAVVAHFSGVALLVNLGAVLLIDSGHGVAELNGVDWAMLLAIGLTATAGQWLWTRAFAVGSPARISVVGLLQIPFSMFWNLLLFHEKLPNETLWGMPLVLVPMAWLMLQSGRRPDAAESEPVEEQFVSAHEGCLTSRNP